MLATIGVLSAIMLLAGGAFVYAASNVEKPKYKVLQKDDNIEIRQYPALRVAEIKRNGNRGRAVRNAFSPLASYIFAREREGEKISMTAPVTQQKNGGSWTVQFIMPSKYTLKDLPKPDNAEVRLREIPAKKRVAIRFSGRQNDKLLAEKEQELRAWLKAKGITPKGNPLYAYYNDPFTPGFMRRNEVLFDF
jgi:DNA gyrase inhibitor GyrI